MDRFVSPVQNTHSVYSLAAEQLLNCNDAVAIDDSPPVVLITAIPSLLNSYIELFVRQYYNEPSFNISKRTSVINDNETVHIQYGIWLKEIDLYCTSNNDRNAVCDIIKQMGTTNTRAFTKGKRQLIVLKNVDKITNSHEVSIRNILDMCYSNVLFILCYSKNRCYSTITARCMVVHLQKKVQYLAAPSLEAYLKKKLSALLNIHDVLRTYEGVREITVKVMTACVPVADIAKIIINMYPTQEVLDEMVRMDHTYMISNKGLFVLEYHLERLVQILRKNKTSAD